MILSINSYIIKKMRHSRENTKKGTNQPEEIIKETSCQSSEAVVKVILDKVITLALYEAYSKEISNNLGDFCFEHIKKEMTSLFELNFINYTKNNNNKNINDNKDDMILEKPDILWEGEPPPENTWVELLEPESESMDRYESSKINYQEIKRDNQLQEKENNSNNKVNNKSKKGSILKNKNKLELNALNSNNNIINEVEEKSGVSSFEGEIKIEKDQNLEISGIEDKSSHSLNITDDEIKKNIENVEINDNIIKNNNKIDINSNINTNDNNNLKKLESKLTNKITSFQPKQIEESLPLIIKKSRNINLNIYPSMDIPGVEQEYNHDNLEPQNVDILRKERQEAIQKKLLEIKNEKIINKVKKNNNDNDKRPKKIFDAKHLTFDSNGNIINFHPYKLDSLKKEFTFIRNLIKGTEQSQDVKRPRKKKSLIFGGQRNKNSIKNNNEENKSIKEIIERPENLFEEKITREREKYVPSGSNFQIISPNYGVVIKENNRFKQGSKEFGKYFQKYSIQDYDKMLNDFVPIQNQTLLKNKIKTLNSYSSNTINYMTTSPNKSSNNIKYTTLNKKSSNNLVNSYDFNNKNNPLLSSDEQGVNNSSMNNLNINMNNISSTNNPLLSSGNYNTINYNDNSQSNLNINNNKYNESYKTINDEKSIIMKKMGSGSLKLELESLKDLSNINSDIPNITSRNKTKNIFRYNSHNNYMNMKTMNNANVNKNLFSEFNKKIMNSREWGNDFSSKKNSNNTGFDDNNNMIYSRHKTKHQILRELGSNILSGIKIKLPRDRKVDINDKI